MRLHHRILPIPETDKGTVMIIETEYRGPDGIRRDPVSYVIDTGLGDGEVDAAGARSLATVLTDARALTEEPP